MDTSSKIERPSSQVIDQFIKKYGIRNPNPSKALKNTTTKDGYLAQTRIFDERVCNSDFTV